MNEIIQAVSTVGFPIACCCFLLWQNSKQDEYHRAQQEKLRETIDGKHYGCILFFALLDE